MNNKINKQINMFPLEESEKSNSAYTGKIESPVYTPRKRMPHTLECYDRSKTIRLLSEIENSSVSKEEKEMLREAATRHTVFNYENMADYYAHASAEMQRLMEDSALIIIDFEKAIEDGYIRLCESLKDQYREEYPDAK